MRFIAHDLVIDGTLLAKQRRRLHATENHNRFRGPTDLVITNSGDEVVVEQLHMGRHGVFSMAVAAQALHVSNANRAKLRGDTFEVKDTSHVALDVENLSDHTVYFRAVVTGMIEDPSAIAGRARLRERLQLFWYQLKRAALVPPRVAAIPFMLLWWATSLPFQKLRAWLRPKCYTVLGFESNSSVGPGMVTTVSSRPQLPFKGEYLVIPANEASAWRILDIRVGKNSLLASSVPIPGGAFSSHALPTKWSFPVAQISQDVTINVQNISKHTRTFRALIYGRVPDL
jgi:hypothetical protein